MNVDLFMLINPISKIPHKHAQGFVSYGILDFFTLTVLIITESIQSYENRDLRTPNKPDSWDQE